MDEEKALCEKSDHVVHSIFLRGVMVFNIFCAVTAIPLIILVAKSTYSHQLVHYNIKWILIFHLGCLVAHDVFRFCDHMWDLVLFLILPSSSCHLFSTERCLLVRIPVNFTMYLAFSGTFMLSIERCCATWKLNTYDRNRIVGPILVLIQIFCASVFMYVVLRELSDSHVMAYCLITSLMPPVLVIGSIITLIFLQVAAIVTFLVLMKINRAKKHDLLHNREVQFSHGVMSKLYQVRENLRTMKTLMLFFILSCVNSFCYNLLRGLVHLNKTKISSPVFFALIEISIHLPQFSLILPAVLWYSYRKVARQAAAKHQQKMDRDAPENTRLHFNMIAESWK